MALNDEMVNLKAIFTSLMEALEVSDPHTRGHSDRVGSLAVALGIELDLSTRELQVLQDASVLHDIGKIGVRKDVLNKPGKLTPEEFEEVKQHVVHGYHILKPLGIPELLDITLYHHERIDGKGYPEGRTDYPLLVRVLQTADVWDALTSDRPYRKAMSYAEARKLMDSKTNNFGFDPAIMETFLRLTRYNYPDVDVNPRELEAEMREIEALRPGDMLGKPWK
jgi:HD-GYP domain-containing protein (c-di-GMP phosphodiesterase class II)